MYSIYRDRKEVGKGDALSSAAVCIVPFIRIRIPILLLSSSSVRWTSILNHIYYRNSSLLITRYNLLLFRHLSKVQQLAD